MKKKKQNLRVNSLIIFKIKNKIFSGYYFYLNYNISGDFQIYIGVPSTEVKRK